jgi:hypothetical protein
MAKNKNIFLKIDDVPIQVEAGTTIMKAAEQLKIHYPIPNPQSLPRYTGCWSTFFFKVTDPGVASSRKTATII